MHSLSRLSRSFIPALLLVLAGIAGCRDYQPTVDPGNNNGPTTKTTVIGRVVDDAGQPVPNATVTLHGATVTSDADGIFAFVDATIPADRALVQARASGYFTASRGFTPATTGSTVRLTLANRPLAGTVSAASGGTVSVGNGASVRIPAGGVVRADGTPYSGAVRVMARAWKPGDADFNNCFPGDARAQRTDGSASLLVSLGFQNVELEDGSGNELKLAAGTKATLTYTIPSAMQSVAPDRIPLWYFDETKGAWIEEGEAIRQGTTYVGEVAHFTPWNCDWSGGFGRVCGTVKVCGEDPAEGIVVNVGPVQTTTDASGNFCVEVAAGWDQPYDVYAVPEGNGGLTSNHVSVPTVDRNQTINVDLTMTATAVVYGRLVDCDSKPISGVVRASWDGAVQAVLYARDGRFVIGVPAGKAVVISSRDHDVTIPVQNGCARYDAGDLQLCSTNPTQDELIDWSITVNNGAPITLQCGSGAGLLPGSATLANDGTLDISAQGPPDLMTSATSTSQLRIHARGILAPGTYKLGWLREDPAAGVLEVIGSGYVSRLSTDQDSLTVAGGRDSLAPSAPGLLTITSVTATAVEGSFNFNLSEWQSHYTLIGSFVGTRKP